ncbi:hypothetical protein D9611_009624 [Ephemerocybe angulata]|uniref:Uncharacterized protein n=1 Tax=Ephemerocybe angulata TaxID=980116 RepID=A0A8H5C5W3_9AGAR|nr:hypothetical protein D9611_009624 [Tulosesus angulatus]
MDVEGHEQLEMCGPYYAATKNADANMPSSSPPRRPATPDLNATIHHLHTDNGRDLPETDRDACQGQPVEWLAGPVWSTYVLQQHLDLNFPWVLRSIEGTNRIRVQSRDCLMKLEGDEKATKIFYSYLDPGHKRLKLSNARGVDHINPASWEGNVIVGEVDLKGEYLAGREAANNIIAQHYGDKYDFDALFSSPNHDHLRPDGTYIGVSHTDKDDDEDPAVGDNPPLPFSGTPELPQADHAHDDDPTEFDQPSPDQDLPDEDDDDDAACTLNPLPVPSDNEISAHITPIGGKPMSKHTLVAERLGSTSVGARKSITRTHRVRGDTKEGLMHGRKGTKVSDSSLDDGMVPDDESNQDLVTLSDPGVVLVHSGKEISLCVAQVLNFRQGSSRYNMSSASVDDLADPKKEITIAVQFMELVPRSDLDGETVKSWEWTGDYLRISAPTDRGRILSQKSFAMRINADRFFPITPQTHQRDDGRVTWSFPHKELLETMEEAWGHTRPDTNESLAHLKGIPVVNGQTARLPLRFNETSLSVSNPLLLSSLTKHKYNARVTCKLCHDPKPSTTIQAMRNHVALHILRAHRGIYDEFRDPQIVIGLNPCGWCGMGGCRTQLSVTKAKRSGKTKYEVNSDCEYHWSGLKYENAKSYKMSSPSTNLPIHCTLCPPTSTGQYPTFWKYNFYHHMILHHKDPETLKLQACPKDLRDQIYISLQEEHALGIHAEATRNWRDENEMPYTDPPMGDEDIFDDSLPLTSTIFPDPTTSTLNIPAHPGRKRAASNISHISTGRQPSPTKQQRIPQ